LDVDMYSYMDTVHEHGKYGIQTSIAKFSGKINH
jgi:hypothetical protein